METLNAIARLVLAGVFVVSAIAKLRDRPGSRASVEAFGVPSSLVALVVTALPVTELACAALLVLPDPFATVGAVGSLALLVAFTAAIVINLVQGKHPECHCFGDIGEGGGIGWTTVIRNLVLMSLAGVSLIGAGSLRSAPAPLGDLSAFEGALLAGFAVVVGALVATALALRTLMQRYGSVLLRLEALEQATGIATHTPAPDFRLLDLEGVAVTLDDVLSDGRPAMLVFVSPTCHNCTELLPDLATWQTDLDHPFSVVVISNGTVADNRAKIADVGPLQVLLQEDLETSDAYGIQGTPGAVIVGTDGLLTGPPMHAVTGVRRMHESIVNAMTGGSTHAGGHPHLHQIAQRPVAVGDPVPDSVVLRSDEDVELSLEDALDGDKVLLFWRTDCGFCQQIVEDVRELERSVPVRIITGSDLETLRASGLASPVLRDSTRELESWLGVPGTPSAARIRDGALDSAVMIGGPDVLALLREFWPRAHDEPTGPDQFAGVRGSGPDSEPTV